VNAGVDEDIRATQQNEQQASADRGHVWSMKGKKFNEVPRETVEFKL
jgi:hypothetical protein